jgi:hypothetical protein
MTITDQTRDPPPPGDTVDEDWLRAMEEKHGPGWVRIFRRMEEWRVYEIVALRYYQAIDEGRPPPEIRDGIQRHYAYIMGSTIAQRNKAIAENYGREYERVHSRAISSFHSCVNTWQSYRDALGLPLETSRDDVEAAYGEHRKRGGWVMPPPSWASPRCG